MCSCRGSGKLLGNRQETRLYKMARRTLLLTSFGAFPGALVNPTEAVAALAARLVRRRLERIGIELVTACLPVVFAAVGAEVARLQARHAPLATLHLGLASRRDTMTPETRATNRLTLRYPDASGARAQRLGLPRRSFSVAEHAVRRQADARAAQLRHCRAAIAKRGKLCVQSGALSIADKRR